MSALEQELERKIDERVEKALEEKLPLIIRALGIREAEPESAGQYGDALDVAKMLGRDLSTKESINKAKKHVYDLARKKLIPSIRISERNLKFDLAKVRQAIDAKQTEAA